MNKYKNSQKFQSLMIETFKPIRRLSLLALLLTLVGCTNSTSLPPVPTTSLNYMVEITQPIEVSRMSTLINSGQRNIKLKARLTPETRPHIDFHTSSLKRSHIRDFFEIDFSDEDCTGGHKVSVVYSEDRGVTRLVYFQQLVPWDKELDLEVSWGDEKNVVVRVNDEIKTIALEDTNFSFVSFVSYLRPMTITNLTFNTQNITD